MISTTKTEERFGNFPDEFSADENADGNRVDDYLPGQYVQGILHVYKPPRVTSRAIVDQVNRQLRLRNLGLIRVGHAGTLDPLAEGVLVLAIGSASRLIPYLHMYPKTYHAKFELGRWSDSADLETDVIVLDDPPQPSFKQVIEAADSLTGRIRQVPPMHSAVKVGGKRAYEAARNSKLLDLTAREIVVHRFQITDYDYPTVSAEIDCGTGTYVRSLGVELGKTLGTKALMSHLVRTEIGPFKLADAIRVDRGLPENFLELLQPPATATGMLPQLPLNDELVEEIDNGRAIYHGLEAVDLPGIFNLTPDMTEIAGVDSLGRLRGILIARHGGFGPKRVFRYPE
jgi:tRNA pseudouridine55 synthase